jgi:PleD family two-component response regulator
MCDNRLIAQLIAQADKAMYTSKARGKDEITFAAMEQVHNYSFLSIT